MAMNVAEGLLNHAKEGKLNGLRETVNLVRDLKVYLYVGAGRKTVDDPARGGDQACLVEQRGMKKLRKGANLLKTFIDPLDSFPYGCFMGLEVSGFNESIELKLCGSELLAGGIMQLAGDAAALFILQGHQVSGKPAQGLFGW